MPSQRLESARGEKEARWCPNTVADPSFVPGAPGSRVGEGVCVVRRALRLYFAIQRGRSCGATRPAALALARPLPHQRSWWGSSPCFLVAVKVIHHQGRGSVWDHERRWSSRCEPGAPRTKLGSAPCAQARGAARPPLLLCYGNDHQFEHITAKTRQLAGLRGAPS